MGEHKWAVILIKEYEDGLKELTLMKRRVENGSNSDSLTDKRVINSMIAEMKIAIKMMNRYTQ